jgi:iron complex outermembrane recepter protein
MKNCFVQWLVLVSFFTQASLTLLAQADSLTTNKAGLYGTITDASTNQPLAGASIFIHDAKTGAIANSQGNYRINQLPKGRHLIEISYLGYTSTIETIIVQGSTQKNFALNTTVVENDAVVVTGVSTATKLRKMPIPVTIIKQENLWQGNATNLIDALSKTPGVSQIATGPAISKPSIRGLGYNRVVVIADGVRQEGQQWGDEHGIEVDEYAVNKVELLKGPASIMYGSDALAGVVNIISWTPAPEGTLHGNIFSNYQFNNKLRGVHANINANQKGFIWGMAGSYKAAADYTNTYDGPVFNSKFFEKNAQAYIGLNKSWGYTHLQISHFNQYVGLIEGARDSATGKFTKALDSNDTLMESIATLPDFNTTQPSIPYQHIQHLKITANNSLHVGKDRLAFTIAYQRNQRQEFGNVLQPATSNLYFDLTTASYTFQYHIAEQNKWKTSIGLNGMQQWNKNKGLEQLIPNYQLLDMGGFVYTQKNINQLTLSGGLRLDNRWLRADQLQEDSTTQFIGVTKKFFNLSASLGASYDVSDKLLLKLNIAKGFRAPSLSELASNGAHEGTNRYEYGVQQLRSETSWQLDAGLTLNTEHVSLNTNIFYNTINNFIYYRKLSNVNGTDSLVIKEGVALFAFQFDQQPVSLFGGEINLDIHPHPLDWLHIENSFSYVRGKLSTLQDGSNNLPFIPAARLINELKADFFKKGKYLKNTYLKIELDNTFAQKHAFTGFNTETNTPGYSLLNLSMGFDLQHRLKKLGSFYFSVNNVTDIAYQSHLSRLKYTPENLTTRRIGVFNMGRNYSAKLVIPFSIVL